eukprot:gene7855-1062_t
MRISPIVSGSTAARGVATRPTSRLVAHAVSTSMPQVPSRCPSRAFLGQQLSKRKIDCAFSLVPATVTERLKEQEMEALLPLPTDVEGIADDPSVHNPLQRMERLGTGWFGVIMEYEGVIVESAWEAHTEAWLKVADEFGYPKPLGLLFRRIRGCRDELVISRVFNWTHNPTTVRTLAERKAQIFDEIVAGDTGRQPALLHEVIPFIQMMKKFDIPIALVCPMKEQKVIDNLKRLGLSDAFDVVVTAEDSGAPEVEYYYMHAASRMQRPPMRCIVVGESNSSVEGAHELGMQSLIPAGNKPVYDFVGADLVVRHLGQVAFLNLKKLFGQENLVRPAQSKYDEFTQPEVFSDKLGDEEEMDMWEEEQEEEDDNELNAPWSRSRGRYL